MIADFVAAGIFLYGVIVGALWEHEQHAEFHKYSTTEKTAMTIAVVLWPLTLSVAMCWELVRRRKNA